MKKEDAIDTSNLSGIDKYIANEKIKNIIIELKSKFGENYENMKVSDLLDKEKNQYVDLVQEGGGMLGIALLGFTYILEETKVRFRRLAGTSAGAINTAMLTVIGNSKSDRKSIVSLNYLNDKDLFEFVDGHPSARWFIRNFIKRKDFFLKIKSWAKRLFITLGILIFLNIICIWFIKDPQIVEAGKIISAITIALIFLLSCAVFYIAYLLKRFKRSKYGINPGRNFLNWMTKIMDDQHVHSISDLNMKASQLPSDLEIRKERLEKGNVNLDGLTPDVTFIVSEIISQNKIEFPRMWKLFHTDESQIHPAEFVRASMSIPVFFESHEIKGYELIKSHLKEGWKTEFGLDETPSKVRFVDGGILSNFPISIFYNKNVEEPRLPTLGVRLYDVDPEKEMLEKESKQMSIEKPMSFLGYAGNIFNTTRFHYDKDFLLKNKMYQRGIKEINVHGFNWLNFNMSEEDRISLFEKGAEAAKEFLLSFDWEAYKQDRAEGHRKLEKS